MAQPFKAAIRAGSLKSIGTGRGGIASAESHAKRLDPVAQGRVVEPRDPIAWSKAGGPLDYVEAFKTHKRETGAGERKGSGLAIEFKAVVSPDWLAEGEADPRDPENPRVRQLVAEAQAWAESWGGKGAVWAVRYATDEKGAGVVDLFMSPVRQQQHKTGKAKAVISCRKAKDELLEAERALDPDLKTSGAAMQSSWARRCGQRLDARIERGMSREMTGRNHVHADVYAREADRAHLEVYEDACREANQIIADAHAEARRATLEAEDASRSWMKAAKAAQRASEAATIALRAEMEAQRQAALEEHTRLMGLAGTPEFRPEADMEVFNNIERVVMDWRLLKAEKQAFRTERDAALDARTREVLAENVRLKEQVYRYDDHGEIKIRWWFSRSFRETVADSTHWAIMDRQTVFALRSKYSIQLLQHIASRTGQRFRNGERFSVHSLRAILAVPEGKLMRFADLNKYALKGKRWGGRPPAASMCHCGEC